MTFFALVLKALFIYLHYLEIVFHKKSHLQEKSFEEIVFRTFVVRNSLKNVILLSIILKKLNLGKKKCFHFAAFICHELSIIMNICHTQGNQFGYIALCIMWSDIKRNDKKIRKVRTMLWIQWRLSTILKTSRKICEMCFDVSKNTYILKVYLDTYIEIKHIC